jgi:hypothetical protein
MLKERSKGVETAKCGEQVKLTKNTAPMTIWYVNVDCPGCLEAMGMVRTAKGKVLMESDIEAFVAEAERGYDVTTLVPRAKRIIPRQPR